MPVVRTASEGSGARFPAVVLAPVLAARLVDRRMRGRPLPGVPVRLVRARRRDGGTRAPRWSPSSITTGISTGTRSTSTDARDLEDAPEVPLPGGNFERTQARGVRADADRVQRHAECSLVGVRGPAHRFRQHQCQHDRPASLLLAEFGLVYGNDWFVVPYNLPVGSLAEIKGLIVTDVFGVRTLDPAGGTGSGHGLATVVDVWPERARRARRRRPRGCCSRPRVAKTQEGDPIERIIFARDEITNMVWAVEERIPGVLGLGVDGFERATAMSTYFRAACARRRYRPEQTDATIRYRSATRVPENWIPFIATRKPGSQRLIRLQRASMQRLTDAIPDSRVEPRGTVLRTVWMASTSASRTSCTRKRCRAPAPS